ncbi:unnamed protein product [Strongylus vulgaris]|uniref:Uncharacterized protein n=1 Tax=Strongylus vulgaris TaxID=40348 RepID=A0A3P7IRU9_STRVU|nr:unnamed protein product [Strongylus vulgaris]
MSEYLGWTERRPPFGAQKPSKEDMLPGGPVTQSFENYVKNVFHPMNRTKQDSSQMATDHGLSASRMLKMERTLGKYALDDSMDSYDDSGLFLKTPLESLYSELGLNKSEAPVYSSYREKGDEEYAKNNRKTLIDYKDFDR